MDETQLELLLMSYTLEELLEDNDIEPTSLLKKLIDEGTIDIERYFDYGDIDS